MDRSPTRGSGSTLSTGGRPGTRPNRRVFRRVAALAASALLLVGLLTERVAAHGPITRLETPIPLWLLFAGAGATVAVTALALAVRAPGAPRRHLCSIPPSVAHPARLLARTASLLALLGIVLAGLRGPAAPSDNAATVVVWPLWFSGLALVSAFVGSPWRTLSPWRAGYDLLSRLEGRNVALRPYPTALGSWPALVGYVLLLGVGYNLTRLPDLPRATVGVVAAYGLWTVGGAVVFGREWLVRADPLDALYRLLGRAAPLAVTRDGDGGWRLALRVPWRACRESVTDPALPWLVVAAVYTVSFDGAVETTAYQSLYESLRAAGAAPVVSVALYLLGLAAFLALFSLVAGLVGRLGAFDDARRAVALSVVPVAAAYEVAHTYAFVLVSAGRVPALVGGVAVDTLAWLPITAFWVSQVVLVVVGHVVAVVAAHAAVTRHAAPGRTLCAHLPLVALMVGYTVLSLWILSAPLS